MIDVFVKILHFFCDYCDFFIFYLTYVFILFLKLKGLDNHIICFLPAFVLHVIGPYYFLATPHGFDLALHFIYKNINQQLSHFGKKI